MSHLIKRFRFIPALLLCLTLPAPVAKAVENQGFDETTGIIHNGLWQNGVLRWLRFGWREQELTGITQVAHVACRGQLPFVDATLEDAALPLGVALRAWLALVPQNAKDSSLSVAFFEFTLNSTNPQPVEASLLFSPEHFVGCGGYQAFKSVEAVTSSLGLTIELSADSKQWQRMDARAAQHQTRYLRLRPALQTPSTDPWRVIEVTVRP